MKLFSGQNTHVSDQNQFWSDTMSWHTFLLISSTVHMYEIIEHITHNNHVHTHIHTHYVCTYACINFKLQVTSYPRHFICTYVRTYNIHTFATMIYSNINVHTYVRTLLHDNMYTTCIHS